eukprot:10223590-Heterocapsa_arctica.AAC.1
MADRFAVKWPETAATWKTTSCWDPDLNAETPCDPEEKLYFVFEGLPMGWSWSLFFAQAGMSAAVMRALLRSPLPADRE